MFEPGSFGFDLRPSELMERSDSEEAAYDAEHGPRFPVALRIRRVAQPDGGWLPVSAFDAASLGDPVPLFSVENVPADVVGLAVDYLTRVCSGSSARDAFRIPLAGAVLAGRADDGERLLSMVSGLSDRSVAAACRLCGYDAASRRGPSRWDPDRVPDPDYATLRNVRRMVGRSLRFIDLVGPVVWGGFTFDGGYTDLITDGSGDLLTADGLWDLKVSRWPPNPVYTLQLLVYWRMGLHSIHPEYRSVGRLGLYNPRSDMMWSIPVSRVPERVIDDVERLVIGYRE